MRSFFLTDPPLRPGVSIHLPKDLNHHLNRVLRLQPGAEFRLFDGTGLVADAVLQDAGQAYVRDLYHSTSAPCRIQLIQGLARGDKTELILQKGTELGVSSFHLVTMERSVARFKPESRQRQRWEKTIQEAARQCGQYHLPQLLCSPALTEALEVEEADLKLLLWEQADTPLTAVLATGVCQTMSVIVGPEGGITEAEAATALAHGYQSVSLGPRILRTETAGLAIITVLQYLYGDLSCGSGSMKKTPSHGKDIL
ncbi:MAG: RsmE family RNA methyltransferase [Pelovirga sp.]